jgi:phosphatidylglycerol:prolipoprotein diacylglycerol transferase
MYPLLGEQSWITAYGVMLVLALLACWYYARRRAADIGFDVSQIDLAVPVLVIVSILGAGLLAFAIPGDLNATGELYQAHFRFRVFGVLLLAFPLLFLFSRLGGQSFRVTLDLFALPALLWLAILRVGCFLAGCCWGDLVHLDAAIADPQLAAQVHTLPWLAGDWSITAVRFPEGSFAQQQHYLLGLVGPLNRSLPVHPTQLYESAGLVLLLAMLRGYEKRAPGPGRVTLMALGGYCILRFFIEYLRADNALVLGIHTSTQVICVILLLAVAAGFRFTRNREPTAS